MGLNLSIRRVVFSSLRKFDGVEERALTAAEIRQVAGRAGRYASRYPAGVVTALDAGDLAAVRQALEAPSEELAAARLLPSLAQLEALHARHPGDSLPALLRRFAEAAEGSLERTPHYRLARFDEQLALATMLRHLPLGLREAWAFSTAPAAPDDAPVAAALLGFAAAYASRRAVTPAAIMLPPLAQARSEVELQQVGAWQAGQGAIAAGVEGMLSAMPVARSGSDRLLPIG
jgi:ATP-dependent RNA helicase SUPV3L1/SUV3